MKTVIATCVFGDTFSRLSTVTHPSIRSYAEKIGSDFVVLSSQHVNRLLQYDRICLLHSDVIIRPDTPSLFSVVPSGWIGLFSLTANGPIVVDRDQLELIAASWTNEETFRETLAEFPSPEHILDVGLRFNRLPSFDDQSNGWPRWDFYIIHYSGLLKKGLPVKDLEILIREDLAIWQELKDRNYHRQRLVVCRVGGGLGDQVCAEPVVREIRRFHPWDFLIIESHWPDLWKDLKGYTVDESVSSGKADWFVSRPDTLVYTTYGNFNVTLQLGGMTHPNMSSTDLSSHLAITRPLPPEKRNICLGFSPDVESSMLEKVGCSREWLQEAIVLHPGLTWPTRTLKTEVWNGLIDEFIKRNKHVVVIGQGSHSYPGPLRQGESIGVLNVEIPDAVIDTRDRLTVKETLSLLSIARLLISNDSAPIHLAGATDIWIAGMCTTKHTHFVFPYRHGSPYYKTTEINHRPSCWPCGVDALRSFPEGLRVDLCKNYDTPYCCHPSVDSIIQQLVKEGIIYA